MKRAQPKSWPDNYPSEVLGCVGLAPVIAYDLHRLRVFDFSIVTVDRIVSSVVHATTGPMNAPNFGQTCAAVSEPHSDANRCDVVGGKEMNRDAL